MPPLCSVSDFKELKTFIKGIYGLRLGIDVSLTMCCVGHLCPNSTAYKLMAGLLLLKIVVARAWHSASRLTPKF